jgi:uncharacterized membrane protein YdjX (TVP38/TMEM64 family)
VQQPSIPADAHAATLKIALGVALVMASTFSLNLAFGWFRAEDIQAALLSLRERPVLVASIVVLLLSVDSVLAIPTATTVLFAGHLLGPWFGTLASSAGLMACGSLCFWGARRFGASRFADAATLLRVEQSVGKVGPAPLILCRALPLLPEALSVLAGLGAMRWRSYYVYFALGSVPFAGLLAYAGSISSFDRPWPAVAAALGLPVLGMAVLFARRRRGRR